MDGYVKNVTSEWAYAMKRTVKPGGEIPLSELYEQYGKKHGMDPDEGFVDWLQNVKLNNRRRWQIVYDFGDKKDSNLNEPKTKSNKKEKYDNVAPMVSTVKMSVEDIVNLTVRKAREELPRITDIKLLKYALSEARQIPNKDSLCQLLYKRIRELSTVAR